MFSQVHAQCFSVTYNTISRGVWPHQLRAMPTPFCCFLLQFVHASFKSVYAHTLLLCAAVQRCTTVLVSVNHENVRRENNAIFVLCSKKEVLEKERKWQ